MDKLSTLLHRTTPDPWRQEKGFEVQFAAVQDQLFATNNRETAAAIQNSWLAKHQPCFFGKSAANLGQLSHCILFESDINVSDAHVESVIQEARLRWSADAFYGRKSGFVISVVSPTLAFAKPDEHVQAFALHLCRLYLQRAIEPNQIYHDDICLEGPTSPPRMWLWRAGVNYFSAHGDGRWWQDHRLPGGIGLSINSVGHMVKSGQLGKAMEALSAAGFVKNDWGTGKIDSLPKALIVAMQTIANATDAVSGPATYLESVDQRTPPIGCPIQLPPSLESKNHCQYAGFYHTDQTIPAEYFVPDVSRPSTQQAVSLDFTYLFNNSIENEDHQTMGQGRQLRQQPNEEASASTSTTAVPRLAYVVELPMLVAALRKYARST